MNIKDQFDQDLFTKIKEYLDSSKYLRMKYDEQDIYERLDLGKTKLNYLDWISGKSDSFKLVIIN